MSRVILAITGIAVLIAASLAWQRPGSRRIASVSPRQPESHSVARLLFRPHENERYTYSFERKLVVRGFQGGAPEVAYSGELHFDISRTDTSGFEALVSAVIKEFPRFSSTLRIRVGNEGETLEILREPSSNSSDGQQQVDILKDLLANWVFPLRSDTVGAFDARFERLPEEGGQTRVKKTKLGYDVRTSATLPQITRSLHLLKWDERLSLPLEVSGEESTRLGSTGGLSSESNYLIRWVGASPSVRASDSALSAWTVPEPLVLSQNARHLAAEADDVAVRWPVLMRRLGEVETLSHAAQLEEFGEVTRALRLHPELAAEVAAFLTSQDALRAGAGSQLFKTAVGALASAGTPEAQAAILRIYQDPACRTSGKGTILAALTTTQALLEPSTRDFLATAMRTEPDTDLAHGAAFAVGAALQNSPNDARSAQAMTQIRTAWTEAKAGEKLVLLDVIGNSGRSDFVPELSEVIQGSDEPEVRAKAVFALRFMPAPEAVQTLGQRLATDPEARVREAAVEAMKVATWSESFRRPLLGCESGEAVLRIQASCHSILRHLGESGG